MSLWGDTCMQLSVSVAKSLQRRRGHAVRRRNVEVTVACYGLASRDGLCRGHLPFRCRIQLSSFIGSCSSRPPISSSIRVWWRQHITISPVVIFSCPDRKNQVRIRECRFTSDRRLVKELGRRKQKIRLWISYNFANVTTNVGLDLCLWIAPA